MKKKKRISILLVLVAFFMIWYFFLKASDYTINFKADTFPQTINQSLKLWSRGLENSSELEQLQDFNHLRQTYTTSDSTHIYDWHIKAISDSTSKVTVGVKDKNLGNRLFNRLLVPFTKTDFSIGSEKLVLDFMTVLQDHIANFRVTIIGVEDIPEKTIAFVALKKSQMEKVKGMMEYSSVIASTLMQNELKLDGPPMVEVTYWNRVIDSIHYNYGYPLMAGQDLPKMAGIEYKTLQGQKGIKAIYNGNYMTSDRAWYVLLDYAKKHNIKVKPLPIEIFHNNPNFGGDALFWKTEVFLPLASDQ